MNPLERPRLPAPLHPIIAGRAAASSRTIDVFDKLAEFKEDPNKANLIKQAAQMGYASQNYSIGHVTDLGKQTNDAATPEEKLVERVRDIVEDY